MSYAVSANSNSTLVTTSVAGDTLTLDFQDQQYGTAEITVTATSGVRTRSADTFIVTIDNVNDLPVVALVRCRTSPQLRMIRISPLILGPVFHDATIRWTMRR